MAKVNVCDVEVLNNPATFFDKFEFKITFECHEPLEDDLEWKVVYVGSAYNDSMDQTLDSILVGPVPVGRHQFVFEVDAPDPKKILPEDLVGVTVVLIQALYHDHEFIRIGYYVNNEYKSEELRENPPKEPVLTELTRSIVATDPRVTRFPIDWGDGLLDGCPELEQKEVEVADEAGPSISAAAVTNGSNGVEGDVDTEEDEEDEELEEEEDEEGKEEPEEIDLEAEDDEDDEDLEEDEDEEGEGEEGEEEEDGDVEMVEEGGATDENNTGVESSSRDEMSEGKSGDRKTGDSNSSVNRTSASPLKQL